MVAPGHDKRGRAVAQMTARAGSFRPRARPLPGDRIAAGLTRNLRSASVIQICSQGRTRPLHRRCFWRDGTQCFLAAGRGYQLMSFPSPCRLRRRPHHRHSCRPAAGVRHYPHVRRIHQTGPLILQAPPAPSTLGATARAPRVSRQCSCRCLGPDSAGKHREFQKASVPLVARGLRTEDTIEAANRPPRAARVREWSI